MKSRFDENEVRKKATVKPLLDYTIYWGQNNSQDIIKTIAFLFCS